MGDEREKSLGLATAEQLLLLANTKFPFDVSPSVLTADGDAELDSWEIAAPAFLFTGMTCLVSIVALGKMSLPRGGSQDAFVLLRRLYEHAVTFAWIATDPERNAKAWVASDFQQRLKVHRELVELGHAGLRPATEAKYRAYIAANPTLMPGVKDRTIQADKHWAKRIELHGRKMPMPSRRLSFEALYTLIYRAASADAHATVGGLHPWVRGRGGGKFTVGVAEGDTGERFPFTLSPIVFAAWLFVNEHVLGWPNPDAVTVAFASWDRQIEEPDDDEGKQLT